MYDAINDWRITIMQMIRDLIKSHYAWAACSTSKKRKKKCSTLLKKKSVNLQECEYESQMIFIDITFKWSFHRRIRILRKNGSRSTLFIWFWLKSFEISIASSGTEAGLRDHVMWLQSRDVTKMTVYRTKWIRPEHFNIYRGFFILDRTSSNTTMCFVIYTFDKLWARTVWTLIIIHWLST
jgi:hypothetical protein